MYKFKIQNMSCKSCLHNIEDAVKGIDPESQIKGNISEKEIEIQSAETIDKIKNAIEEAGYNVTTLIK